MKLLTVYLTQPQIDGLDEAVRLGYGPHRAELIRLAVRDFLADKDLWKAGKQIDIERIPGPNEGLKLRRSPRAPGGSRFDRSVIRFDEGTIEIEGGS